LYEVYLRHLLETVVAKGETPAAGVSQKADLETSAQELALLLRPLSALVASNVGVQGIADVESFSALQRDAWYNLAVHGFSTTSLLGKKHLQELKMLARYTQSLIAEERANNLVSDVDLNTVLRRRMSTDHTTVVKREMCDILPQCDDEIKSLSYPELIFLKATHMVETLRAADGDCTKILRYFVDRQLRGTSLGLCVANVAGLSADTFLANTLTGTRDLFSAPYVAQQLTHIFEDCCHRVDSVQKVAYMCAEKITVNVPSALCQRTSLFTLLDLLSIMWAGCLEAETDEFNWTSTHVSASGTTSVQLSDDYPFRRHTLKTFHRMAREWVGRAINLAPLDVKGLLQVRSS
jgi:phosphatidylinositol 4-kinase